MDRIQLAPKRTASSEILLNDKDQVDLVMQAKSANNKKRYVKLGKDVESGTLFCCSI